MTGEPIAVGGRVDRNLGGGYGGSARLVEIVENPGEGGGMKFVELDQHAVGDAHEGVWRRPHGGGEGDLAIGRDAGGPR